jgi:hypothetical protein
MPAVEEIFLILSAIMFRNTTYIFFLGVIYSFPRNLPPTFFKWKKLNKCELKPCKILWKTKIYHHS